MKRILILLAIVAIIRVEVAANNLEITDLTQSGNTVTFELSWDNSWRSTVDYHDAAWIFVKQAPNGGSSWQHANIASAMVDQGFQAFVEDNVGVMIRRTADGSGSVSLQVQLTLQNPLGAYRDIKVFGMEMVFVPEDSFYLGDGYASNRFSQGDDDSQSYHVTSGGVMSHGSTANDIAGPGIVGDVPAAFPNGYSAFYCMKYPVTAGQYVDFLNCQDRASQDSLVQTDLSGTTISERYVLTETATPWYSNPVATDLDIGNGQITFYCDYNNNGVGDESDDGQWKGLPYLRVEYTMAYLDWAGLAPLTNMEYEKACRGPLPAVAGEYAWGSNTVSSAGGTIDAGTSSEVYSNSGILPGIAHFYDGATFVRSARVGISAVASGGTRETSGGSYYGIMEMSYYCHPTVRSYYSYTGQHGDGSISNGMADSFGSLAFHVKRHASTQNHPTTSAGVSNNLTSAYYLDYTSCRGVRRL